jgi:hypothetical protein
MCRWLDANHPYRTDPTFGEEDRFPPPPNREAQKAHQEGLDAEEWLGSKATNPRHTTGIALSSPLSYLHMFDIIWDICPDMMHILKNFSEKILVGLLGGERVPKWSTKKNPGLDPDAPEYEDRLTSRELQVARYDNAVKKARQCVLNEAQRKEVDARVRALVGPVGWIKHSMVRTLHKHKTKHKFCVRQE